MQLGIVTEELNRIWYERNTGRGVTGVQSRVKHSAIPMATLDGVVEETGTVFESKFMLPWSFSEEAAAEKYMAQLQHNMWVTHYRQAVLSIITGGANGLRLPSPWTHSILASWSRLRKSSGDASNPANLLTSSMPSRRVPASRQCASSI